MTVMTLTVAIVRAVCHDCHDSEFPGLCKVLIRKYPRQPWEFIVMTVMTLMYHDRRSEIAMYVMTIAQEDLDLCNEYMSVMTATTMNSQGCVKFF
jgi:hypothetical protein